MSSMAMFHSHIQVIARSSGRSSVAAAAYRSGTCLVDERTGAKHDFTRKAGVSHSEIVLPDFAPQRWRNRETLWNDVERSERSANAQLAREIEYALPREFSADEQIEFARAYAKTFADEGMVADFSIHQGRNDNPHVHMMLTMRPCDADGFTAKSENVYLVRDGDGNELHATAAQLRQLGGGWSKVYSYRNGSERTQAEAEAAGLHPTRGRKSKTPVQSTRYLVDWNEPEKAVEWRERLARMQNERLAALGCADRVDHRSYAERGIGQVPTLHEGVSVRHVEAKEKRRATRLGYEYQPVTSRRRENIAIRKWNAMIRKAMMEMANKAMKLKRSITNYARTMKVVPRGQSANARKRTALQREQKRIWENARGHQGLSR